MAVRSNRIRSYIISDDQLESVPVTFVERHVNKHGTQYFIKQNGKTISLSKEAAHHVKEILVKLNVSQGINK